MKLLFTYSPTLLGIHAPWFSWAAAIILFVWPSIVIIKLALLCKDQSLVIEKLITDITELHDKNPLQGSKGLNSTAIDHLHQMINKIPSMTCIWNSYRSKLIYRQLEHNDDAEQVWQIDSSGETFTEDALLGGDFDKRQFHSVPGIVTGFGLLMTFVAILVGLYEVRIIGNNVTGLENLIGGLSGKFVSSVAALFSASAFMLLEKRYFHRFNKIRRKLIDAIDSLIPRRSDSHILEEISQNIAEQTNAFRTFNSDLSLKLRNSFSESMGPTLDRMVSAIEALNQLTESSKVELLETLKEMNRLLVHSEESKQESISGQIEFLLKDLQKSLSDSLDKMSSQFSKSLTGTAQDQFSRVAVTVGTTAEILDGMNQQFSASQVALQELITLAKQSTENQFTNGSALIERMVDMLGGTMTRMEEQVTGMSSKMANTIEGTAERSTEAASGIINEVRALNEQTVQKFVEALHKHEQQLDRVDALKNVIQEATGEFAEYVTGYNTINADLKTVSQEANSVLQMLARSSITLKQSQDAFSEVATLAINKIGLLAESNDSQKELWNDISASMNQYKNTFSSIESNASTILSHISDHLQNFSKATKTHFDQTVSVANDHVNKAVGQLGVSIETLGEKLDDLSDIFDSIPRK